jgi:hypothetical protein
MVDKGVTAIEQRLNPKSGPRPGRQVATRMAATLKTATRALQKARSRLIAQDYRGVMTLLVPVRKALDELVAGSAPTRGRAGR